VIVKAGAVPADLQVYAGRAANACPTIALLLEPD
jgi:hypothetical protein